MLYNLDHILRDIELHVEEKKPFSIVRIGDGDLKLLDELIKGKVNEEKFRRSGIPHDKVRWILDLYRDACNSANYTSSFEMYYTKQFWGRKFSSGTKTKVKAWKELYAKAGIKNENFCNPEIGHLLFLDEKRNLLKLLRGKKVCLITSYPRVGKFLDKSGVEEVSTIRIPDIGRGHYNQYDKINKKISNAVKRFDIFLISAGALGKGYAFTIKNLGGIAIDVGQVINFWAGRPIAGRFKHILIRGKTMGTFKLKPRVQKFREFI